jgi:hypothetical protein
MWTADTDPMWDLTYYAALTYEATITVGAPEAGAQMTIDYAITGLGAALEYRRPAGDASAMWGTETSHTWTDDAAPFRSAAPGWRPWPGTLIAEAGDYDIRVRTTYGRTRGTVGVFVVNLDVADLVEYLDDIDIAKIGLMNDQLAMQSTIVTNLGTKFLANLSPAIVVATESFANIIRTMGGATEAG